MRRAVFVLLSFALLCAACGDETSTGSGGEGGVAAPLIGTWTVFNDEGVATGQEVVITADHIRMTTPNLSPSEGKAVFSTGEGTILADWYGSTVTFTVQDADTVRMEKGPGGSAGAWNLRRK